jgi:6-phosphogluconolactonase (cycloisomerase 2 family)
MSLSTRRIAALAAFASIATSALASSTMAATVYTQTNSASGNQIQVYRTGDDGSLGLIATVPTRGLGTDGGLGNQGALAMTKNGHWLFAVNAGSDEVSAFAVTAQGLVLVDKASSGGTQPVSLTVHENMIYVLNSGGSGNISGLRFSRNGHLQPIANSTRPLSSATAGAAEIAFDREGETLVVTEKSTGKLSVYSVDEGRIKGPVVFASNGQTPFGFAFDRHNNILVSEAFGGAANASAISSYDLDDEPLSLETISGSIPAHQTAACWVVLARHGRFAYVTNTGSGTVTGFKVDRHGALTPLNVDGLTGVSGGNPLDAAVGLDESTMYVLSPKIGKIIAFHVGADGSLAAAGSSLGVPLTATGLVAR